VSKYTTATLVIFILW